MEFFRRQTNIDFLGIKKWTTLLSVILMVVSIGAVMIKGMNWGLDFTGGYQIQLQYQKTPSVQGIKQAMEKAGLNHINVVTFGSTKDIMLSLAPKKDMKKQAVSASHNTEQTKLRGLVAKTLPTAKIVSVSYVGPEVGAELAQRGVLAMIIAVIATMIYIALRFEMRFAVSSAIALAHDPIIIVGVFSLFQIKFDLNGLAAVLAVIGYSLNDTVVVYDRVRENFRKLRKSSVTEVVNRAINDTLSRTVMTSGLTLLVVVVLFFFGGPSIHGFSLALIIGVVVGTYSSIYVAGALAVLFGLDRRALIPSAKKVDELP